MFSRIRYTWQTLSASSGPPPLEPAELRHPPSEIESGDGEESQTSNAAVRVIEILTVVVIVVLVIPPLVRLLLGPASGRAVTFFASLISVAVYSLMNYLHEEVKSKVKLTALNPYFGRRLAKVGKILRGGDSGEQE